MNFIKKILWEKQSSAKRFWDSLHFYTQETEGILSTLNSIKIEKTWNCNVFQQWEIAKLLEQYSNMVSPYLNELSDTLKKEEWKDEKWKNKNKERENKNKERYINMIQEKLIQILKESLDKIHPENINAFFDIIEFSKRHLMEFGVVSNYWDFLTYLERSEIDISPFTEKIIEWFKATNEKWLRLDRYIEEYKKYKVLLNNDERKSLWDWLKDSIKRFFESTPHLYPYPPYHSNDISRLNNKLLFVADILPEKEIGIFISQQIQEYYTWKYNSLVHQIKSLQFTKNTLSDSILLRSYLDDFYIDWPRNLLANNKTKIESYINKGRTDFYLKNINQLRALLKTVISTVKEKSRPGFQELDLITTRDYVVSKYSILSEKEWLEIISSQSTSK